MIIVILCHLQTINTRICWKMKYKAGVINVCETVNVKAAIIEIAKTHPEDHPFYVSDVDDVIYKYDLWRKMMPRIEPHYALKCNDSDVIARTLAALGLGFDCASKTEMEQLLSIGVDPSKIIFAHTIKSRAHMLYAVNNHINLMTFDNAAELEKMKFVSPNIRAVIRIKYDSKAFAVLGLKYGCDPYNEAEALLKIAANLNVNVVGVSFHIGSGSEEPSAFYHAIKAAHYVFEAAKSLGYQFNLLDIGGGFPRDDELLYKFGEYINRALDEFFSDKSIRVISEPGAYFVGSASTLASCIFAVKKKFNTGRSEFIYNYYINDGVFGSLSAAVSYDLNIIPEPLNNDEEEKYPSIVWGPTTELNDVIQKEMFLPKMNYGDYLIFKAQGSYRYVGATNFNGLGKPDLYYIISSKNWFALRDKTPMSNKNFHILV